MKLEVYNINGKSAGRSVDMPNEIFEIEPNAHAVYLAIKQYNAAQRQGTHKAKERGEIKGSTKKVKKQKGTGTARAGSIKNPLFRGGGRVFGPKPRDYDIRLNKKVKNIAKASAFSYKANQGKIVILEDFDFDSPKTKEYINVLKSHDASDVKSLMLISDNHRNVYLSARNLSKSKVCVYNLVNTYDLLNADKIFISEEAVKNVSKAFSN